MDTPPKDRIEVILMADQADPAHLWIQSTAAQARRMEFNKETSVRILGGAAAVFLLSLYLIPAKTVILLLLSLIILFPLKLIGMAGFSRGR